MDTVYKDIVCVYSAVIMSQLCINTNMSTVNLLSTEKPLKVKCMDTCYSAAYSSHTRDQQRFTISEVAANSALCGHPLPALMDSWTHSAASRHTTSPISHTRPSSPDPMLGKLLPSLTCDKHRKQALAASSHISVRQT